MVPMLCSISVCRVLSGHVVRHSAHQSAIRGPAFPIAPGFGDATRHVCCPPVTAMSVRGREEPEVHQHVLGQVVTQPCGDIVEDGLLADQSSPTGVHAMKRHFRQKSPYLDRRCPDDDEPGIEGRRAGAARVRAPSQYHGSTRPAPRMSGTSSRWWPV
jgi:hypothetical protein